MEESGATVLRADTAALAPLVSHLPLWNVLPPVQLHPRCVSCRGDMVAIGTQLDILILFDKKSGELQKISLEESGLHLNLFGAKRREGVSVISFSPVTPSGAIRLAMGRCSGDMHAMQISDRDHERKSTALPSVHKAEVTALEWDTRGMMLFSADTRGQVYATHLDMLHGKHNSWLVYDARQDVLQISYSAMLLLVVTAETSTICNIHQNVFQKKPARVQQSQSQPLTFRGGVLLKGEGEVSCYLSCQMLSFARASLEGQLLHVSPLEPQVEYGTFDTLSLSGDSAVAADGAEQSLQFGRTLFLAPYLVTWCSTHVWLMQPIPALTVIAACKSDHRSPIVDVCVDHQSIFVLRRPSSSKLAPILRLAVACTTGASSPSRSRSSSATATTVSTGNAPLAQATASAASTTSTDSPVLQHTVQAGQSAHSPSITRSSSLDAASTKLQESVSALTDRFKNLVHIGPSVAVVAENDQAPIAPVAEVADVRAATSSVAEAQAPPAVAAVREESKAADTSADTSVDTATSATSQLTSQSSTRPAAPAQSGWLDKLRVRGAAPGKESEAASTPSPSIPTAEARGAVRQWMTDEPPSMKVDQDDLVVATSAVAPKKRKKKKKVQRQDDLSVPSSNTTPAVGLGRDRTDSTLSEMSDGDAAAATAAVDGDSSAFNLLDSSHNASAMLQAVQSALRQSTTSSGDTGRLDANSATCSDTTPATELMVTTATDTPVMTTSSSAAAAPADLLPASTPAAASMLCSFAGAPPVSPPTQTSGEVTAASLTSSHDHSSPTATAAASVDALAVSQSQSGSDLTTASVVDGAGARDRSAATAAASAVADRDDGEDARADSRSNSFSADPDASHSDHLDDSGAHGNASEDDLVLQSYDASLPAHIIQQPVEEEAKATEAAGPAPRRYNSQHLATLDSACKLSPPSRRHLHCLAMSKGHIWIADSGDYIYCWSADTTAWVYVKGAYAVMLASCASTFLLWALSRQGIVSARVGIVESSPLGRAWIKLEKLRLKCIALDYGTAWLITKDGQLMRRRNLSVSNPLGEKWQEEESTSLGKSMVQIAAAHGVLWALSSQGVLCVRMGVTDEQPLGNRWQVCSDEAERFYCISLGPSGYGWAVTKSGPACFKAGVTAKTPLGDGRGWWLVSLGQQLMKETSLLSTIKDASARVTSLWSHKSTGQDHGVKLIASSSLGVSVVTPSALLFSTSEMTGMTFKAPQIGSLAHSSIWLVADASTAYARSGLVWLLSPTGEIFSLPRSGRPAAVSAPVGQLVQHLSASNRCVFGLAADGTLYMRVGVSEYCPAGLSWVTVSLPPAMAPAVSVSCGNVAVWLVDGKGDAWIRAYVGEEWLGEWMCIGRPGHTKLVQVVVGPGDWHVWACDSSGSVHVRTGVNIDTISGTEWDLAPDIEATDIAISTNGVWVRCTNGDIVWRANVTPRNPVGDYWRRIPGSFAAISATPDDDELWLLNDDGVLFVRETCRYCVQSPRLSHQATLETWEVL